ncbi:MAG: hypothetical protein WC087_03250 [Candidatus Paceibacterota bacterium]
MKNKILISSVLFLLTVFLPVTPFVLEAQTEPDIFIEDLTQEELDEIFAEFGEELQVENDTTTQEGLSSCFDYYNFNSVQVNINSNVASTVPGSMIAFSGTATNNNNYPIVNGTVYIKIFKMGGVEKNSNGQDVVDQFIALRGITLKANESKDIEFEWRVPAWTEGGDYQAATFFISNDKYNFLGLSFTDDIVGNTANFKVNTRKGGLIYLDKNSVKVDGEDYYFAAFPPRVSATSTVNIVSQINNMTSVTENVRVTLKLYSWDSMHSGNLIKQEEQVVSVAANGSIPVSFNVTNTENSVYLAEISLDYKDTKSFLNIRFVRDGVNKLRINFPAVSTYPLMPNEEVDLFACIHNTADDFVDGTLRLTVNDEGGKEIYSNEWSGVVGGEMIGIASKFKPEKLYGSFSITAELLQDGKVVETDTVRYSCSDFKTCDIYADKDTGLFTDQIKMIVSGAVVLLILLALIFMKKKSNKEEVLNV